MKIPKTIKIGGIIYDVEIQNVNHTSLTEDKLWGSFEAKDCKIYINGGLCKQTLERVFLHEVLHAIEANYCLEFNESEIDRLSFGLLEVLKDNNLLKD
jgi:hypothetical protein